MPSTLYAGTFTDGVFKSTDGGATWALANAGLTTPRVSAVAIDPSTPSTLYVASSDGGGVSKSTDAGATWSFADRGLPTSDVSALVIDPSVPGTLYAASYEGGVFKSTDAGATWDSLLPSPPPGCRCSGHRSRDTQDRPRGHERERRVFDSRSTCNADTDEHSKINQPGEHWRRLWNRTEPVRCNGPHTGPAGGPGVHRRSAPSARRKGGTCGAESIRADRLSPSYGPAPGADADGGKVRTAPRGGTSMKPPVARLFARALRRGSTALVYVILFLTMAHTVHAGINVWMIGVNYSCRSCCLTTERYQGASPSAHRTSPQRSCRSRAGVCTVGRPPNGGETVG